MARKRNHEMTEIELIDAALSDADDLDKALAADDTFEAEYESRWLRGRLAELRKRFVPVEQGAA